MKDEKVCPICVDLEGYTWTLEFGKGQMKDFLEHPKHGIVWDVQNGSQAHGHKGNCRCNITYVLDTADMLDKVKKVRDDLIEVVYTQMGGKP